MKKSIYFFMVLAICASCVPKGSITVIKGEAKELEGKKLYLYELSGMYGSKAKDSAEVKNNTFTFTLQGIKPQLYSISTNRYEPGYVFVSGKEINMKFVKQTEYEGIEWEVTGSPLHDKYAKFTREADQYRNPPILDSLDKLFFAARDKEDKKEMIRIKELSIPYYEEAEKNYMDFVKKQIEVEKENIFGLFLYYRNIFVGKFLMTDTDIEAEKKYLDGFGSDAKQSAYMDKIKESLVRHQNCAVGHQAPEIAGVDTAGNPVKLSDFKGKHVLVDFWNSYCTWCRKETPTMQKVYDKYKDKGFTILGVSSDRKKSDWVRAIHEDKSYWNHIITEPKEQHKIDEAYCITGIPHIILVAPDGKILAKELRGEKLIETVEKTMK